MKRILPSLVIAFACAFISRASGADFADAVIDYTPGVLLDPPTNPDNNPAAALGQPSPIVGAGTGYDNVFNPFNPHYESTDLTGVGSGGQLTLQLQNYVRVQAGAAEIGVWTNVGLADSSWTDVSAAPGTNTNPASELSPPRSAVVSVSSDGVNWVTVNGGSPITFSNPGNFFLNAGPYDSSAPANPQYADFGKPFTGTLSDFDGEDYAQTLQTLDGSAGGTWLNLDGTGLSQVGFIRFNGVPTDEELYVDAVSINSSLAGDVVPEPASLSLLALGGVALLARRRVRR